MKARMYWRYATRSLARNGQRTLLAIFCVAVGVLVIVSLQLVGIMTRAAITGNIRALNGGDVAVHSDYHDLRRWQLAYFDQLKAQGVISAWTASGGGCATTAGPSGSVQRVCIDTVDPALFPLGGGLKFVAPDHGDMGTALRGNGVVLTQALAQMLGSHTGDTLSLAIDDGRSGTFTVTGIVANTGFLEARPDLLMAEQTYEALPSVSAAPMAYTWIWVNVPSRTDAAASAVADRIHTHFPLTTSTTVRQQAQSWSTELDGIDRFLQVIGLLALLIGGVGIVNTMQVLLRRRLLEIAMLKTQGYRRRDLILLFGVEASVLGLAGGALGALAGIGMSYLVRALFERAFFLEVPAVIDAPTVAGGVGIGLATTLIFGLLPIVRASGVRPLAVLRETQERAGCRAVFSSGLLLGLLGFLFFLLALGILRNAIVALAVVAGSGLLLMLLTGLFAGLAALISRFPVLDRLRWWYALFLAAALVASVTVAGAAPGFGLLLLAIVFGCGIVVFLPRPAKSGARLALRSIGRAKVRSATTLVALFAGVFAVGVGLALGQGLKATLAQLAATNSSDNAYILATSRDAPAVRRELARAPGLSHEQVTVAAPARVLAVNGTPLAQIVQTAGGAGSPTVDQLGVSITGLDGYDLAGGELPSVTLERGQLDDRTGRNLTAADAATTNALLPLNDSQPPLNLRLGDSVTVGGLDGKSPLTLRVAGFYTSSGLDSAAPVLVDRRLVDQLSGGNPLYAFAVHLDAATMDATLRQIKQAAPGAVTVSLATTLQSVDSLLDNIVQLVESVASLAMLAGLVMIANTVALAMLERRRELGILKALGFTSRGVLGTVLLEVGVLAMAGAFLAMLLVTAALAALGGLVFKRFAAVGVAPPLVLGLVAATAGICLAVAALVAWPSTRVRPLEVLRYE